MIEKRKISWVYSMEDVHPWMNEETVVHLHTVILLSCSKKWNDEIYSYWIGLEKYPSSKWSNPELERQSWYVFANICNIAVMSLISKL